MKENQEFIIHQETPRDYRTEIPNIVQEMNELGLISNAALLLYMKYRKIAGDCGGCWVGVRQLEKLTHLSDKTIAKAKKELSKVHAILGNKSLIHIQKASYQKQTADTITIFDIWHTNHTYFKNKSTCRKMSDGGAGKCRTQQRTKEESCSKEQQTGKPVLPAAAVVVFSCLENLNEPSVKPKDKERISKTYPEEVVKNAIAAVKQVKPQISFLKTLNAACKEAWKPNPESNTKSNQRFAKAIHAFLDHEKVAKLGYEITMKDGFGMFSLRSPWSTFFKFTDIEFQAKIMKELQDRIPSCIKNFNFEKE